MSGKQDTTEVSDTKKAKLDNVVVVTIPDKENEEPLKVYPKRNRKQTIKACESAGQIKVMDISVETNVPIEEKNILTTVPAKPKTPEPKGTSAESKSTTAQAKKVKAKTATTKPKTTSQEPKTAAARPKTASGKQKAVSSGSKSSKSESQSEGEGSKRKRCMPKTVDKLLEKMDIRAGSVSCCLKAAMSKGFIKITGNLSDLDQVVCEGTYDCHTFKVLVKDVLYQPDYAGLDYEDGCENATALCTCCNENDEGDDYCPGRVYVTRICTGNPDLDSGKFHNHCTMCKGFGVCINDYREAHCMKCNKHWFTGLTGFPCDNCKRIRQRERGVAGLFMGLDSDEDGDSDDDGEGGRGDCTLM